MKLSSIKIKSDASLETSLPLLPIDMPICAYFKAGASLTPSPVIATISPLSLKAFTIRILCSGTTRENILTSFTLFLSSSSLILSIISPVIIWLPCGMFTFLAIADAVDPLSPVIITTLIPALLQVDISFFTDSLGGSSSPIRPQKSNKQSVRSSGTLEAASYFFEATAITRKPW